MNGGISRLARAALFGLAVVTVAGSFTIRAVAADRDREHWRDSHRWHGYYARPDVYYSAPPVVYPPEGYYARPGISLNFNFPIR